MNKTDTLAVREIQLLDADGNVAVVLKADKTTWPGTTLGIYDRGGRKRVRIDINEGDPRGTRPTLIELLDDAGHTVWWSPEPQRSR